MARRDPILSKEIILSFTNSLWTDDADEATMAASGIPLPTFNMKPAFRQPVYITDGWASGATPTTRTLYTVPAGKKLKVLGIHGSVDENGSGIACQVYFTDGSGGSVRYRSYLLAPGNSVGSGDSNFPLTWFDESIVHPNGQQEANVVYSFHIWGYLEDESVDQMTT